MTDTDALLVLVNELPAMVEGCVARARQAVSDLLADTKPERVATVLSIIDTARTSDHAVSPMLLSISVALGRFLTCVGCLHHAFGGVTSCAGDVFHVILEMLRLHAC